MAIAGCCTGVAAQAPGRALTVTPSLSVTQTVTDDYREQASNLPAGKEAITALSAGVRVAARGARLQGNVDYTLTGVMYAQDSPANDLQNSLRASLQSELIERHLFVSMQASIAQQPISALEVQTPDGVLRTRNRTEVSSVTVKPTLQGRLGAAVDVQGGLTVTGTDTGGGEGTADSANVGASLRLSSPLGPRLGWSMDSSRQYSQFRGGRRTVDDRVVLGLTLTPDVDWQLRARAGYEANNFRVAQGLDSFATYGAGLAWTPSPRTRLSLDGDKRSFGHSHTVTAQHRSRRTLWRYTDSLDVSRSGNEAARVSGGCLRPVLPALCLARA